MCFYATTVTFRDCSHVRVCKPGTPVADLVRVDECADMRRQVRQAEERNQRSREALALRPTGSSPRPVCHVVHFVEKAEQMPPQAGRLASCKGCIEAVAELNAEWYAGLDELQMVGSRNVPGVLRLLPDTRRMLEDKREEAIALMPKILRRDYLHIFEAYQNSLLAAFPEAGSVVAWPRFLRLWLTRPHARP